MKYLKLLLVVVLVISVNHTMNAQDENNPYIISFGLNAVDFYPVNTTDLKMLGVGGGWYDQFFNASEHYNLIPTLSKFTVGKYLKNGFSLQLSASFNKIEKVGDLEVDDFTYIGMDLSLKYGLRNLFSIKEPIHPYVLSGVGYTWSDANTAGTVNLGAGVGYWFNDHIGLLLSSLYKHSTKNEVIYSHFQHSLSVAFKFGGTDTDGDGIYDKNDQCINEFGLASLNGCPDADRDGFIDSEDKCPNLSGEFEGCPDTDLDGIYDPFDECPEVVGNEEYKGCPWIKIEDIEEK